MVSKFDAGDEVAIPGIITVVTEDLTKKTKYKVKIFDVDGNFGFVWLEEKDLIPIKKEDKKNGSKT